jgi:two-component system LytT family response regulator
LVPRPRCQRMRIPDVFASTSICHFHPMTNAHDSSLPLRVAIVYDEALARSVLREYLTAIPDVEVIAECANGFEAVKVVAELKPDLLLLDVQMPKLDGFEVLDLVGRDVAVIFVTAFDQYALRAFEVHAVDYLLKPFSADRLGEALGRARERLSKGERLPVNEVSKAARPANTHASRVLVRDGSRVHVLPVAKIAYVQAQDDYAAFFCEGKEYLKEQTLTDVESSLDPAKFVRIHRSYLLNLDWLARVELDERENRIAVLTDGRRLPVSRAGYTRLAELL